MQVAIYSRKSRLTDKGDSIENQIELCKTYINQYYSDIQNILIYRDEGFSGSNTNRPMFQQMIHDAHKKKFNVLICYRLDRISRNIAHFANTYEILQQNGIEFISIKEQFDTSTPIGRAMLNIAMVFAQLERETIAERIRDNMQALAYSGRWLGGTTPTGFKSTELEYYDQNLNKKRLYTLSPINEEIKLIKLLFEKFLELKSLRQVELYFIKNNIKTKNNCYFSAATIKDILTNPVYACADNSVYKYFNSLGAQVSDDISKYDGKYGISAYNRTDQTTKPAKIKNVDEWIISVGRHPGVIPGTEWIKIQKIIKNNIKNNFHSTTNVSYGLLSNLIKCGKCGSTMRVKKDKKSKKTGEYLFYYVCTKKENSKGTCCNIKNIRGHIIDKEIIEYLNSLFSNKKFAPIKENNLLSLNIPSTLEKQIEDNNLEIQNLINQIAKIPISNNHLILYFENKINSLHNENMELKKQISLNSDLNNKTIVLQNLRQLFPDNIDNYTKRYLVKKIIDTLIWYEDRLDIHLHFRNSDNDL